MSTITQLSPAQRTLLWTLGAYRQMRIWGLVDGPDDITAFGLAVWDQLDAEWKPTDGGISATVACIASDAGKDAQATMRVLLKEFRDNRERMREYVENDVQP